MTWRESAAANAWPRDFGQIWFAARAMLQGLDPYPLIGPDGQFHWGASLMYPLPAVFVGVPFAPFSEPVASALFSAVGAACLAWSLMEYGYGPLFGFFSISVREAMGAAQWSMLLASSLVLWPLSALCIAKPTVGLALFAARPRWIAVIGGVVLSTIAYLTVPTWVNEWLHAVRDYRAMAAPLEPYRPIVTFPLGVIALASLLRWRRPEARLVAVLACVPLNLVAYELVPLLLVPRTFGQAATLVGFSYFRHYLTPLSVRVHTLAELQAVTGLLFAVLLYLPTTWMILRRPNVGAVPHWLERRIERWPVWLRGSAPRPAASS